MPEGRLSDVVGLKFNRHESFPPRFGWLHKAYLHVKKDEMLFHAPDALVRLGVGKNMVYSMRYWSQAFKLTHEYRSGEAQARSYAAAPTWRARWLLDEDGADPYLEDTGSLWLLHWWLVSGDKDALCLAPSWYVTFHLAPLARVTHEEMTALITREVHSSFEREDWPAAESIARDVDCIIKMYAPDSEANPLSPGSFEDSLLCPFKELGLLEYQGGRGKERTYRFTSGIRPSLPPHVLLYACLDYAARFTRKPDSISLARLAGEPGGPGRAFRMREPELLRSIEAFVESHPKLEIVESLGQSSLRFADNPESLAWDILDEQYGRVRERDGFPTPEEWARQNPGLMKTTDDATAVRGQIPQQADMLEELT
ncbi:hypothetical protein GCM10010293_67840 [Streptomyces griseoflavus]|uniref:DUF4007 family protein n=1 Tax=Streptomyces griseoflavus TaxID=35619 RepID=UPI00167DDFEF|nr:DUF4007 family protein [Streptomyces griseoflavus]GGV54114.1 hypothetical protein GCM10010293_67840 [Streptomyces griseoflavus]